MTKGRILEMNARHRENVDRGKNEREGEKKHVAFCVLIFFFFWDL